MNKQNQFLADYVYLAEASYTDFSKSNDDFKNLTSAGNGEQPYHFAKLVTDNYKVVAHYKDRDYGKESSFSATLFKGSVGAAENEGQYVLAIKGTKETLKDLIITDGGDIVLDGSAHHQIVDLYNFWQQIISPVGQYHTKQLVVVHDDDGDDLTTELKTLNFQLNAAYQDPPQTEIMAELDIKIKDLHAKAQSKGYIVDIGRGQILKIEDKMSYEVYSDERKYGLGIKDIGSLVVSGHSLGGHLTAAFARLFPEMVEHAYMVNGAGFGRDTSILPKVVKLDAVKNIENLFNGLNQNNKPFDTNKITNIIGTGIKVVANDWAIGLQQPGQTVDLFIETATPNKESITGYTLGHSSAQMSDSMIVASLFFAMDSSLNTQDIQAALNTLNPIFKAAHSDDAQTLEKIVHSLRKLFLGDEAGKQASSRDELYQQIMDLINLKDAKTNTPILNGQYRIVSLAEENGWQQLASKAESAYATAIRYALKNLNPFAVAGLNYASLNHNTNHELDLYSPEYPNGMTETYIQKRVEMLQALISHNTDAKNASFEAEYHDLASKQSTADSDFHGLANVGSALKNKPQVIFGSDKNEQYNELDGGFGNDYLFGGAGDDVIQGDTGNDYLEGGIGKDTLEGGNGFDTYFADNNDTISDSDGKGEVLLNNVKLVGGVQDLTGKDKDVYYSEDGSIKYRWNKETKELTVNDGLVIQDFDNEELGINLVEAKGQDIAFVVDVSGSMGDDINAVVKQLDGLLNMIFSPKRGMMDSRISVVAYEKPITVLQKFTQHDTVAERKAAAKQAIAKLPNMIGGGTEYLYTALYTVLSGGAGEWRKDAKARHIFLIGDEPGDDAHLAKQVYALAKNLNINANVTSRSSEGGKFYDVRFQNPDSDDVMSVNIHPIMIGNNTQLSDAFHDIAQQTGGNVHQTQGASDIVDVLYDALQSGTAGDDVQIGNEANNTFNGRAGNDKLFGYGGNDTLNGGVGNDVLDGGEGADKFVFSRYFGQDVVYSDKLDTFVFNDISLNNLKFIQTTNHDLLIQQQGTQNQVTVTGFFDGGSSFAALQDDFGNTLSAEQVKDLAQPMPNADKNQTIIGNILANQLFGGSGDDVIKGLLGNDFLRGNSGNDRLEGGWGADTYVFKAGDGNDTLYDTLGNDTLRFEDVGLERLWFSRDGKNLQIDVLDNGGSVTIENYFTSAKSTHFTTNAIEHFQADGHHLFAIRVNRLLGIMDKFKPTEHTDWNVDMQKQHYLQNNHIEQYWQAIEQY